MLLFVIFVDGRAAPLDMRTESFFIGPQRRHSARLHRAWPAILRPCGLFALKIGVGIKYSGAAIPAAPGEEPSDAGVWVRKGVTLPTGTWLRMTYNGESHTGR